MKVTNTIIQLLILLFACSVVRSQDTLLFKEVYIENDLVYKYSDDQRFTGVAVKKRKNGNHHCEQYYNDGVILYENTYYKGKDKKLLYKTYYNRYRPWVEEKEYYYRKSKDWLRVTSFNDDGDKILVEEYENGELTYSCQYAGSKKHGIEFCFDEEGNKMGSEYINGKRVKHTNHKKSK